MSLSPGPTSNDNLNYNSDSPLASKSSASNLITDIPPVKLNKKIPSKRHISSVSLVKDDDPTSHSSSSSSSSSSRSYRDRAEERRKGLNLDYQDTQAILAMLNTPSTSSTLLKFDRTHPQQKHEGSIDPRYLDQDPPPSTLLVQGVDLSLYHREGPLGIQLQSDSSSSNNNNNNNNNNTNTNTTKSTSQTSTKLTPFIKTLLEAALKKAKPPPFTNPHCYPGRMAYLFSPEKGEFTVVLRSTDQVNDFTKEHVAILSQVIALLEKKTSSKQPSINKNLNVSSKQNEFNLTNLSTSNEMNMKTNANERKPLSSFELVTDTRTTEIGSDEEDIFADAGRDYALELDDTKLKKPSLNDSLPLASVSKSVFSTSTTTPMNALDETPLLPTSVNELLASIPELLPSSSSSSSSSFTKKTPNASKIHSKLMNQLDNDDIDLDKDTLFWSDRMTFVDHVVSDLEDDDEEEEGELKEQGNGNEFKMNKPLKKRKGEKDTLAHMQELKNEVRKTIESLDQRTQSISEKNKMYSGHSFESATEQASKKREHYSTISSSSSSSKTSLNPNKKKKLDQLNTYMQAKYGSTPFRSTFSRDREKEK